MLYGLKDNVGRVEIKGLGIHLNTKSTQADFARALKRVPSLKGQQVIELSEKQVKQRELNSNKNGNKEDNNKGDK